MRPFPNLAAPRATKLRAASWLAAGIMTLASVAGAQAPTTASGQRIGDHSWRFGASVGSWIPRSAVIVGADGRDTRLGAAPSFSIDAEYLWQEGVAFYGSGTLAQGAITLGSAIAPAVVGPSNQVLMMAGTAGLVLSTSLGSSIRPTLRLGGGLKGYSFDLQSAENQWRPTADVGVGFRAAGSGAIGVSAEVRYLPSSFDQGKLPIRGIVPQAQRQTDLLFTIGVSVRP